MDYPALGRSVDHKNSSGFWDYIAFLSYLSDIPDKHDVNASVTGSLTGIRRIHSELERLSAPGSKRDIGIQIVVGCSIGLNAVAQGDRFCGKNRHRLLCSCAKGWHAVRFALTKRSSIPPRAHGSFYHSLSAFETCNAIEYTPGARKTCWTPSGPVSARDDRLLPRHVVQVSVKWIRVLALVARVPF